MPHVTELELTLGQEFKDFSSTFARIAHGTVFAIKNPSGYAYDPFFEQDAERWVVRSPGGWTIIKARVESRSPERVEPSHG